MKRVLKILLFFLVLANAGCTTLFMNQEEKMRYLNNQGCTYEDRGDYYNAYLNYKEASDMGFPVAEYNLGLLYWQGRYVTQDQDTAGQYWYRSAQKGYHPAMYNYGIYLLNCGNDNDRNNAISWIKAAASRGNMNASRFLQQLQEQKQREILTRATQPYSIVHTESNFSGDGGQSKQSQVRKRPRRKTGSSDAGYLPPEKKNDAGSQDALVRPKDVEKL